MTLDVGDRAPDFALRGYHEGSFDTYRLSTPLEEGKSVLVVFYYCDFSPVCTRQMCDYSDADWFQYKTNLEIFGISRDGPYSHKRFAEENEITYPLLSDVQGRACEAFGVLDHEGASVDEIPRQEDDVNGVPGMPQRSVFLVGPDRTVNYAWSTGDNWDSPETNHVQAAVRSM